MSVGTPLGTPPGTPLGCQLGGLALGGGLFSGGLLYLGSTGCQLCLLPRGLPLCGTLGGELGLSSGFLPGSTPLGGR
jgi:hypothetical protein